MEVFSYIVIFVIGTMLGSFYNVVGYRLPLEKSIVFPRSFCPKCNHTLNWYELFPIFSYLFQKGKCRHCQQNISGFYPLIEFSTGLLFSIAFYSFGFSYEFIIAILIISLLMIVIVSDLNFLIIPDEVLIVFSILIIIIDFFMVGFKDTLFHILTGGGMFIFTYLLMLFGNFLFKKESLGGGDVKLMFVVGLVLHPVLAVISIFLASFIALPVSLVILFRHKENVIPFGPFIILAMVVLFLMKIDVNELILTIKGI